MKRFTRIFAGTLIAALALGGSLASVGSSGAPAAVEAGATGEDTWTVW
ncbi:hypothetical protein WDH52_18640 [Streptomyces sp. TRM70308]|nr:hypothetical protein [Streptomyces sp. JHD 1]MCX2970850.1 hypothetical protein [Streptomyces sp. JHD 1]